MITLDLAYANGSYSTPAMAIYGELLAVPKTANGAITTLGAVDKTIQDIAAIGALTQPNEDIPTPFAMDTAKQLLQDAQAIAPIYLVPTTIEGSDGDLLIHWDTISKGVVLICPRDGGREPQVYKETLQGNRAASHSEMTLASSENLSAALAWVLQPN
jgi:hypothetical protein